MGVQRHHGARNDLKEWMKKINLPYHSPHKFRHGFAVYSLKLANDIGELKAISQNLMHSNISITDGIYGILSEDDIFKKITEISKRSKNSNNQKEDEVVKLLQQILKKLDM